METTLLNRITLDPHIGHGKPTIRNTRYLVEGLLEYLAAGDTIQDVLETFPDLEKEDLLACIQYALATLRVQSANLAAWNSSLMHSFLQFLNLSSRIVVTKHIIRSTYPKKNNTSDLEILQFMEETDYVLITKDKDFYDSFVLKHQPKKLILVRVGNIKIKDLKAIFENNFDKLLKLINYKDLVIVGIDKIDIQF